MVQKILGAQRDFSAGELDVSMKRADEHPIMKIGARTFYNFRLLNSGACANRPGRGSLFPVPAANPRVDVVLMNPGQFFAIAFGNNVIGVFNAAGTLVFASSKLGDTVTTIPWTTATIKNIVWVRSALPALNIYITYGDGAPNNPPQVLSWDGVSQTSAWTLNTYQETITSSGQKRTLFYRLAPANITLLPSATTGNINITFSLPVLTAGMVGTRLRFAEQQLTIKTVATPTTGTATVNEPLPPAQSITLSGTLTGSLNIGDLVTGSISGAQGIVTANGAQQNLVFINNTHYTSPSTNIGDTLTGGTSGTTAIVTGGSYFLSGNYYITLTVNITGGPGFINGENVTGPGGTFAVNSVSSISGAALLVQIIQNAGGTLKLFTTSDIVVGPQGSSTNSAVATTAPQAITVWDQEVMNAYRGFPTSVFADQNRLGFCNFPALPSGIAWSAIGLPTDLYVGALPDEAIFELAPSRTQVFFVQAGLEGSEFVFGDNAIYYIPITPANPLVPGSVAFNSISTEGCQPNVQPRQANQSILYMKRGGLKVGAVQVPGAYYRPYVIDDVSEYHGHLFLTSPVIAIAIPSASANFAIGAGFEELYVYLLLANGQLVVGKYNLRQGLLDVGPDGKPKIGWTPWLTGTPGTNPGISTWVSANQGYVLLTTVYQTGTAAPVSIAELVDNRQYLDGAISVNGLPAAFTPPGGKGPLYVYPGPNSTVTLMDNGTRMMGTYQVDANGFIIPQFTGGENLSSPNLVAGQAWTAALEPFAPDAQPGQDVRQRMLGRRVSRIGVYVSNSTGFVLARLFSGPLTPTSPALGTIMNARRIPAYNVGDNVTAPPPLREETKRWRPLGRSFDPRVGIIKDTPGPLLVHEIGMEISL